jgi:RNA polymerase sigma-70 factor (ECF subfamily)
MALVAAARAGDRDAFGQLVRRHAPAVRAQAMQLLRNEADAADLTQEAFVRAFQKLDSFRGESRFVSWLRRITVNLGLMKLRSRRRRPETSIEDVLPVFVEDGHHQRSIGRFAPASGPEAQAMRRDLIRQAIAELPENYREIILLRRVQELDTQETAALLGISTTAVKLRLHRAHQVLRAALAEECEVPP